LSGLLCGFVLGRVTATLSVRSARAAGGGYGPGDQRCRGDVGGGGSESAQRDGMIRSVIETMAGLA